MKKSDVISYEFAKRSWQVEALNKVISAAFGGANDFIVNAAPGAGKSRFAHSFIKWAIETKFADIIVFCTPSRHLREAIADDLEELTSLRLQKVVDGTAFEQVLLDGVPNKVCGFSLTYQTLSSRWAVIEALAQRHKLVFIGDEIHHSGLGLRWGDAAAHASAEAVFRLGLSGTPFRSDDSPVVFMNYEEGKGIPQFDFFYGEALSKGYVAPVEFVWLNGIIQFFDPRAGMEEPVKLELKEDHEDSDPIKLRAAYDTRSGYSEKLISLAIKRLDEVRKFDTRAGGLVIAHSIDAADKIASMIKNKFNRNCTVVHSQVETEHKIAEFSDGNEEWIVSVDMISEGIDIPRLRVLAYLSVKSTRLSFMQAVGRIIRLGDSNISSIEQFGSVFLPPVSFFRQHALEFEEEIYHQLGDTLPEDFHSSLTGDGYNSAEFKKDSERADTFIVEGSIVWEDGATVGGTDFTQDELNRASQLASNHEWFEKVPDSAKAMLLREAARQLSEKNDATDEQPE